MKSFLYIFIFFATTISFAQPKVEMTPRGFESVEFATPNKTNDKLIEAVKNWADYYNKKEYDVYDVTQNSVTIDALKENAYFYRNLGERYDYNITYTLNVVFNADKTYTLKFSVKEVFAKKVLTKTTVADFFTPDGKLKEDFEEIKPSLENTANKIIKSFSEFIAN